MSRVSSRIGNERLGANAQFRALASGSRRPSVKPNKAAALSFEQATRPLPEAIFDGAAVFAALTPAARRRTSAENVSDVLDALAKVMRAELLSDDQELTP